ncbi:hypothetical protein F3Y22_tig00113725pilonHSYRG00432 [Hibiscus syriacus]|uniref:Uncharacterized protein n=1 Tax=Hibiscus syriacus TaxID=106335 RepID=A0A6A2X015_HIBSY|nr:hypothetical protein F3Y22_tig00113725pilonHSYRG00432 [Hibiscus syriacus]
MSTWRICSDDGSNYRWEAIDPFLSSKLDDDPKGTPIAPYPSMVDLLLQGCSKLIENDDRVVDKYLMFRTKFGNSVALKESSIAKALSILNEDDVASIVTPMATIHVVGPNVAPSPATLAPPSIHNPQYQALGRRGQDYYHLTFIDPMLIRTFTGQAREATDCNQAETPSNGGRLHPLVSAWCS